MNVDNVISKIHNKINNMQDKHTAIYLAMKLYKIRLAIEDKKEVYVLLKDLLLDEKYKRAI